MGKFISRKDLEVQHSRSYEMRGRIKELGCEWDGIARVWIAPSTEVKELCYQILDETEQTDNSMRSRFVGGQWNDIDWDNWEGVHGQSRTEAKAIAYTPTRADAEKISGSGNVLRYWHEDIPNESASILASGEDNENAIYNHLTEQGWKPRQVSLLMDVVNHFRSNPPISAVDEVVTMSPVLSPEPVAPIELNGSIGVIGDDMSPIAFTVTFPYSAQMVNRVKWLPGRSYNPAKKRWEVPIDAKYGNQNTLQMFPHFQRSPKAKELEGGLK